MYRNLVNLHTACNSKPLYKTIDSTPKDNKYVKQQGNIDNSEELKL